MALDGGGGGGGGPVGVANTFTGPASAFEVIGEHVYVLTGSIDADNNVTNLFEATTGNYYVLAKLQPLHFSTGSSDNATFQIYMNGIEVITTLIDGYAAAATSPAVSPFNEINFIIPAYTVLKVDGYNRSSSATIGLGFVLTGRRYRD